MQFDNPITNKAKSPAAMVDPLEAFETIVPPQEVSEALLEVQEGLIQQQVVSKDAQAAIKAQVAKENTAQGVMVQSIADISKASQVIDLAKETAKLQTQNRNIAAHSALGGDEATIKRLRNFKESADRVTELQEESADIKDDQITGIGIIDSVINEFRAIQTDDNLRIAKNKELHDAQVLSTATAALEGVARTNALTQETVNASTIAANQTKIGAESLREASIQNINNARSNAANVSKIYNMSRNELADKVQLYRLENESRTIAASEARNEMAQKEHAVRMQKLPMELEAAELQLAAAKRAEADARTLDPARRKLAADKLAADTKALQDTKDTTDSTVASIQIGQSAMGVRVESRADILAGLNLSPDRYVKAFDVGATATITPEGAITNVKGGETPAEFSNNLDTLAPNGTYTPTKATSFIEDVRNDVLMAQQAAISAGEKIPRDDATNDAFFNSMADKKMAEYAAYIKTGDESNPNIAPPMESLAGSAVLKSEWFTNAIAPLNMQTVNPQAIIDSTIASIQAKTITIPQAQDGLKTFFDTILNYNNEMEDGMWRAGFPKQTSYNVRLQRSATNFEALMGTANVLASTALSPIRAAGRIVGGPGVVASIEQTAERQTAPRYMRVDMANDSEIDALIAKLLAAAPLVATTPVVDNP